MIFWFTFLLWTASIFGYVLLAKTTYWWAIILFILFRIIYWICLGIEYLWERTNAPSWAVEETKVTKADGTIATSTSLKKDVSLYQLYPARHVILFDVIPILQTAAPFLLYYFVREKGAANGINTPRNAFGRAPATRAPAPAARRTNGTR